MIFCLHVYIAIHCLSQAGNDAELLVPELLKYVTQIPLEKYQVFQPWGYMFSVLHALAIHWHSGSIQ